MLLYQGHELGNIPASNELSDRISEDLKKRGLKYIGDVVALASVQLPDIPFGIHHLPELPARVAILMGGKDFVFGLISVQSVLNSLIQTGVPGEYFGDSHYFLAIWYISS